MQVEPVALVGKVEGSEGEDWLFRGKLEEQSVAFTMSFTEGFGLDAKEYAGVSLAIHVLGCQFSVFVAYLPREGGAEGELRIGWSVLHTTLKQHVGSVL